MCVCRIERSMNECTSLCIDACIDQKKALDPLGPELCWAVPPNVGAGIRILVLTTEQQALFIAEPWLQSLNFPL